MRIIRKEVLTSFKEWSVRVPQRWWDMLLVPISYVPVIVGVVAFIVWAKGLETPLPTYILLLVPGGAILFFIVSFIAFHRVRLERDTQKIKSLNIERSKTETLLQMRQSPFYEVINTLDEMRKLIDNQCEANPNFFAKLDKQTAEIFTKDFCRITGTTTALSKISKTKAFTPTPQAIISLSNAAKKKWDINKLEDPKTIQFMQEITGIFKHYHIDTITQTSQVKEYKNLDKQLPAQRRLVLSDGTYKTIERYIFHLEGLNNIYMHLCYSASALDTNSALNAEQKTQLANFKDRKNTLLAGMLKDITLSIDDFIQGAIAK